MAGDAASNGQVMHRPVGISQVPSHWDWAKLDDVCSGIFDCPHSTPKRTEMGPLMARTQDVMTGIFHAHEAAHVSEETYNLRISRAEPSYGDLLYSREGTYFGVAAEIPRDCRVCLGQRMVLIRPKRQSVDHRYLRHWLNSPIMASHIHGFRDGTVAERLNLPTIRALPVLLPPVPEQKAIAHILGTLDEKIELNRRMNATLEGIARAVFKSWFVDFDPVRAKLDDRHPPGLDPATAALFPDGFEDSELGKVPRGWKHDSVGGHVELQRGKTYKSKLKGTPGPYLLGLGSIERNGGFRIDKLITYGGDNPANLLVYPGDLYVSLKDVTQSADLLGAIARVPTSVLVGRMTQDTVKLVFKNEAVSRNILYRTLLTTEYRDYCRGHATGTTNLGLAREDFLSYPLIVPPLEVQQAFDRLVDNIDRRIDTNDVSSKSLSKARDTLLPKLLSGELRVPAATEMLEGV